MAELVNMAGDGLPLYLWTRMAAAGENPWAVGQSRARRDSGSFSYRNTVVREDDGEVSACLIGYPLEDEPQPSSYEDMPAMFVPMQQLEDLAPGTWYVNVLATYPEFRGRGYGRALMAIAERMAQDCGKAALSIIVSDANAGAWRLYGGLGYRDCARRAMVKEQWEGAGENWVLFVKQL